MEEVLRFLQTIEVYTYLILGLFAIWQINKFIRAWQDLREAAFGLEREAAQFRLTSSAWFLMFILILAVGQFIAVTIIAPSMPDTISLATPTLDLLSTPTITLGPDQTEQFNVIGGSTTTPVPTIDPEESGCIPGQLEISSPEQGETVSGIVEINGTVNIQDFGFYVFETAALGDSDWLTLQAGDVITTDGQLGFWDTGQLASGDYLLRLVATNNQDEDLPPCVVQVRVVPEE